MSSKDQQLSWVETEELLENETFPPRRDEKVSEQLVSSMRIHGVITPVLARPFDGGLQVVCGARRIQAARAAGIQKVPTLVAKLEDVEAIRCFLNENEVRRGLDERQIEDALSILRRLRDRGEGAAFKSGTDDSSPESPDDATAISGRGDGEGVANPDAVMRSTEACAFRYDEGEAEAMLDSAFGEDGVDASARRWGREDEARQVTEAVQLEHKAARPTPARWELDDVVERTGEFFDVVRRTRQVDLVKATSIVDELAGIQSDGLPLRPEHVYGVRHEGSWLAPHSVLVASLNMVLAPAGCSREERRRYGLAGLLHDIGMAFFEERGLLGSSGVLTEELRAEMRRHTWLGHAILAAHEMSVPELSAAARDHHERPDGSGYPQGLRGDQISLVARVTALSDVFAALIGPRPHRAAATPATALECLVRNYGFDELEVGLAARLERHYRETHAIADSGSPDLAGTSSAPTVDLSASRIAEISDASTPLANDAT